MRGLRRFGLLMVVLVPALSGFTQDSGSTTVDKLKSMVRPGDLPRAAKGLAPPAAALFAELSRPADRLTLKNDKILLIRPVADFLGAKPVLTDPLEVQVFDEKSLTPRTVTGAEVASFSPYEQIALERIGVFLRIEGDKEVDRLTAADMALSAVLRFHEGARRRPAVGASPWDDLRAQLEQRLLAGRRRLLELTVKEAVQSGAVDAATPVADYLLSVHLRDAAIRNEAKRLWAAKAGLLLKKQDWLALRGVSNRIDEDFAFASEFDPFRRSLKTQAELLMKEASASPDESALTMLTQAWQLWPRLSGLREALAKRQKTFRTLYVAVRSLPEYFSPALAWTDSEKQAVELLFESLIEPQLDAKGLAHYEPRLASSVPSQQTDYRRFELLRDVYWSDGTRMTAGDIRHTVQLLRRPDLAGRSAVWREAFDVPRVDVDAFAVEFKPTQGLFDGLYSFSFKILPEQYKGGLLVRADDEAFAKEPLGSGPFVLDKQERIGERTYVVFRANPHFVRRSHPGRPFIDEIRMFAWRDVKDFVELPHPVHVVHGISTDQLDLVQKPFKRAIHHQLDRRVYFLAINHRRGAFADVNLRRAMAHAIHREKLLTDHFRGGQTALHGIEATGAAIAIGTMDRRQGHKEFHHPLSGPYPVKSWATCPPPRVPANPYDPALARTLARQALKPDSVLELTLKYPAGEPGMEGACKEMAAEIEQLAKDVKATVRVKIIGLPPRAMKSAIDNRDFDLAYHHYDHAGADFDLWPLFDPSPDALRAGGSNYLGYDGDAKLQSLLRSAQGHLSFTALQEITHDIHARLYDQMPLIPLWQLHAHFAIAPTVTTGSIDPLAVFSNVAEWKLQR